ncbi:MAG: YezD family protein [Oscillospiraceae bacterium]|nr:YezD family protein [Oscillospiraceae bacterium]
MTAKKQGETAPDTDMAAMRLKGQERKLIELLRGLEFGEVRIVVKESEIVQIEEKKSIKL